MPASFFWYGSSLCIGIGGRRVFRYVESNEDFAPIAVGQSDPLDESYCQRIVDGRLPELIKDATQLPEALGIAATQALPVGAHLSVPIELSNGDLYGTLCAFSRKPNLNLNRSEIKSMRVFAKLAAELIERDLVRSQYWEEVHSRLQNVITKLLFEPYYQPIFNISEDRIVGHEALTRFKAEPQRTPDKWFEEAIEVGLGEELEMVTMSRALEGLKHFSADTYISVNISPAAILMDVLDKVLIDKDLSRIMVEVTEHSSVENYDEVAQKLSRFRKLGLRLAVDDAGAGYASFRHILKLKPDVIKLDKSIIDQIDVDTGSRALAAALITFAQTIGSKIVAEGVETTSQLQVLRDLKVNKAQGYLLGKPSPIIY